MIEQSLRETANKVPGWALSGVIIFMTLSLLKQIAKALAVQFGPNCEVVIHDLGTDHLENSIVHIENGQVTRRERGGGPSQIVLETLKRDPEAVSDQLGYITRTDDGRTLKCSSIFVREEEGGPIRYLFGVNYDITSLLYFDNMVQGMIKSGEDSPAHASGMPDRLHTNISDILDDLIAQSVALVGKPASMMSREEKMEAIRFLNDSGAFLITKSGDRIAKYFGISKFTLYSYIKADAPDPAQS